MFVLLVYKHLYYNTPHKHNVDTKYKLVGVISLCTTSKGKNSIELFGWLGVSPDAMSFTNMSQKYHFD